MTSSNYHKLHPPLVPLRASTSRCPKINDEQYIKQKPQSPRRHGKYSAVNNNCMKITGKEQMVQSKNINVNIYQVNKIKKL